MNFTAEGLAQKLIDILGITLLRFSDYQIFAIVTSLLFIVTLVLFLTFVFKLIVYISKT